MDIQNCCRLCLLEGQKKLIDPDSIVEVKNAISQLLDVQILATDKCTKLICHECVSKITSFFMFKNFIKRNQTSIQEYMTLQERIDESSVVSPEEEPSTPVSQILQSQDETHEEEVARSPMRTARKRTGCVALANNCHLVELPRFKKCKVVIERLSVATIKQLTEKPKFKSEKLSRKSELSLALRRILKAACEKKSVNAELTQSDSSDSEETMSASSGRRQNELLTIDLCDDSEEANSPLAPEPALERPKEIEANVPEIAAVNITITLPEPAQNCNATISYADSTQNENTLVISNVQGADSLMSSPPRTDVGNVQKDTSPSRVPEASVQEAQQMEAENIQPDIELSLTPPVAVANGQETPLLRTTLSNMEKAILAVSTQPCVPLSNGQGSFKYGKSNISGVNAAVCPINQPPVAVANEQETPVLRTALSNMEKAILAVSTLPCAPLTNGQGAVSSINLPGNNQTTTSAAMALMPPMRVSVTHEDGENGPRTWRKGSHTDQQQPNPPNTRNVQMVKPQGSSLQRIPSAELSTSAEPTKSPTIPLQKFSLPNFPPKIRVAAPQDNRRLSSSPKKPQRSTFKVRSVTDINNSVVGAKPPLEMATINNNVLPIATPVDSAPSFTIRLIRCKNEIQVKIHNAISNEEVHFNTLSSSQRHAVRRSLVQSGNLAQMNSALSRCRPDEYSRLLLENLNVFPNNN